MIGNLFTKRLLLLSALLLMIGGFSASAQTTLATSYTSYVDNGLIGPASPTQLCVTFSVTNGNSYPIIVTEVGTYHMFSFGFQGVPNPVTNNGSNYELWRTATNLTGVPNITTGTGWVMEDDTANFSSGFNGVVPVFTNLSLQIPGNTTHRFSVVLDDTLMMARGTVANTPPTPDFFTQGGVKLSVNGEFSGVFPTPNRFSDTLTWQGNIKFIALEDPKINASATSICLGDMATLTASAGAYYQNPVFTWYKGTNPTPIFTGNPLIIGPATIADTGTYYVTVTGSNTTYVSPKIPVKIKITYPPAPTVDGKFDYCLNEQFEATTVNGNNPKWYYVPAPGGSPLPVTPTINTSSPNALEYYVSQTDQNGCESLDRTYVRYRVAKKPFPPIVNTPVYYCEEAEADQLYAIGDTLRWYYFPFGGVETVVAPTPNTSVNDSFQYYVTQTIDGCESDRSRIDVVVTFKPNGIVKASIEQICEHDSVTIDYFGSADATSQYNWILPPVGTTILSDNGDKTPIVLQLDSAGTYDVKLRVGHVGCLSDEYSVTLNVLPLPYGKISMQQDVCLAQPELLEAINYTPGLDTFMWDFAGGFTKHFTTEQGPYGVYWEEPGEKEIKVTLVDEGCVTTLMDTITVHPKPNANIIASYEVFSDQDKRFNTYDYAEGDSLCASDSLKVSVEVVEPGATYKWTPTRFFDTYSDQAVTYARVDFNSNIYVEVEDIYGCQNKDSLEVSTKSCCEMFFPTAFTPNGDGRNDYFRPLTVGRREIKTFRVVNRYGQAVYESKTNSGYSWGWDGKMEGVPADIGTYFYLVSFQCGNETVDQAGEVILVR